MGIIAIEEHWTTSELKSALEALPAGRRDDSLAFNEMGDHLARLEDIGDGRIATMDEQGIDMQIISVAPPATGPLDPAESVDLASVMNDLAVAAIARHPTRLAAMATLPMASPGAVAGEFERAIALGLSGAMVYGRTGERMLDDPAYDALFASAAAHRLPIFIHPQIPSPALRQAAYGGFDDLTSLAMSTFSWGWHIEAATAALRLIARGTFDRHPDLQIVLGHWGELLLFWQDRIAGLSRVAGLSRPVGDVMRENVHITSSGMFSPALLHHALEVTTIDRLLFSTDYPFQHPTAADITGFLGEFDSDVDREKFTSENARDLFSLDAISS